MAAFALKGLNNKAQGTALGTRSPKFDLFPEGERQGLLPFNALFYPYRVGGRGASVVPRAALRLPWALLFSPFRANAKTLNQRFINLRVYSREPQASVDPALACGSRLNGNRASQITYGPVAPAAKGPKKNICPPMRKRVAVSEGERLGFHFAEGDAIS